MEKLLKPYDKEYMRMAMLKHEETFRRQVNELHRLYHIQKLLMKNMEETQERCWNTNKEICFNQIFNHRHSSQSNLHNMNLDLEQPAEDFIAESELDGGNILLEREIELTLGPPSSYKKTKKRFDRMKLTSDSNSSRSLSSSSTGSSHMNRTSQINVEENDHKEKEGFNGHDHGEEEMREKRLRPPPWLFQVVSFN